MGFPRQEYWSGLPLGFLSSEPPGKPLFHFMLTSIMSSKKLWYNRVYACVCIVCVCTWCVYVYLCVYVAHIYLYVYIYIFYQEIYLPNIPVYQYSIIHLISVYEILVFLAFFSYSVQFNCSVVSNFLWLHGLQHARLPCPFLFSY